MALSLHDRPRNGVDHLRRTPPRQAVASILRDRRRLSDAFWSRQSDGPTFTLVSSASPGNAVSAGLTNTSGATSSSAELRTGRKPSKTRLKAAHKTCFDNLRWELRLDETHPPRLAIDGDDLFGAYLSGSNIATLDDRALTFVVQALVAIVEAVQPATIVLFAGGEAGLYAFRPRCRMLRRVRTLIRSRMLEALKLGFDGLMAIQAGSWRSARGDLDLDRFSDEEIEEALAVESLLDGDEPPAPIEPPPPSDKLTKQAVNFVFSRTGAHFEIGIASLAPLRFKAKGGMRFRGFASGARIGSDADIARTAVARAVEKLVGQFDESVLRGFFPNAKADALRTAGMMNFIRTQVRNAIDAAVAKGGYAALTKLDTWRQDLIEMEPPPGEVEMPPVRVPNEIDELLAGVEPKHPELLLDLCLPPDLAFLDE